MSQNKYTGTSTIDVKEFINQFNLIAAVNKYDDEAKKILIAAYLDGPALHFYRKIIDSCKTYEELKIKFIKEFEQNIDYIAAFYSRKQNAEEDVITYFYALDTCATKAGEAINDKTFINHFLKNVTYTNKCRLASQVYENKEALKATLFQMQQIFSSAKESTLNLPIHISSTSTTSTPTQNTPTRTTPTPNVITDRFHTPTGNDEGNLRGRFMPNTSNRSPYYFRRRAAQGDACNVTHPNSNRRQ